MTEATVTTANNKDDEVEVVNKDEYKEEEDVKKKG